MRPFALALAGLLATASAARAESSLLAPPPPPPPTPFDQGRVAISAGAGSSSNFGVRYFGIGIGGGYYVLDGLQLGLAGLYQWGDGPTISKVSPGIRYVAQPLVRHSPVVPYVGVFYNHWFIGEDIPDVDSVGSRAGLVYVSGNVVIGGGVAVERTVSECDEDCTDVYPDLVIAISF